MQSKHRWSARTAAGLALFLAAACALGAPKIALRGAPKASSSWRLVDLGTLGGSGSFATGVSDNGFVAGCSNTPSGVVHAFLYRNGRMVDLAGDDAGNSCALAVNDRGVAAGRNGSGELVVWSERGVAALGVKGNVGAINDAGLVVGSYTADGVERAFAWQGGDFRDLGTGPGSTANDVNARGVIVGRANGHAFALTRDGVLHDLGTLGGATSVANGINERGQVVGMADTGLHRPTAFVYAGTMQQLAGPELSGAVDLDNRGLVVSSAEGYYGYVVQGDTVTRLDQLPDVVAKGWHHMEPKDVNSRGWIVGTGFDPEGNPRAFLLLPF